MNHVIASPFLVVLAIAALAGTVSPARAQPPVSQAASVSATFVIDAIDYADRLVTLRDEKGETKTIICGPEVQRFDALKVGEKVTFRYYESVVYQIRKPGSVAAAPGSSAGIERAPDGRPGGTISQQMTTTVTVNAVDPKVPSVTVTTSDGEKMSFRVEDPKNLQDVKPDDRVEITYTQALAISVTSPEK